MFKLFDRDFFKFLIGFLVILTISFSIFFIAAKVKIDADPGAVHQAAAVTSY
ncbi:MAG: hypothetical protein K0S38_531 [Candidatus Paceibacter sp.]|jgi:hypothetical protein|nr:hypothetical protein [Candidatus Paceibacter sp.]